MVDAVHAERLQALQVIGRDALGQFLHLRGDVAIRGALLADLVDQLFNSSEKRLARILLLLAQFGKDSKPETVVPKIRHV